jgi:hypothetical protein
VARKDFDTIVESGDRGRVFIVIPFDPSEQWGKKARHYVRGTIDGTPFEGSLGARGGVFFMPVNKELQKAGGIAPGNRVSVVMESADAAGSDLPQDLEQALAGAPDARAFLDGLSAFYRNQYVTWITDAKKAETRASRVDRTVELLKAGKKQR